MQIPLANRFKEPVSAIVSPQTGNWLGFLQVDLLNPNTDGISLLKGCTFVLQMQVHSYYVGKVEKGFDFPSSSNTRKVRIEAPPCPVTIRDSSLQKLREPDMLLEEDLSWLDSPNAVSYRSMRTLPSQQANPSNTSCTPTSDLR
jgi:hypothetical protein